jgi:hypothetical protein
VIINVSNKDGVKHLEDYFLPLSYNVVEKTHRE